MGINFRGAAESVYHGAKKVAKPLAYGTSLVGMPYLAATGIEKGVGAYNAIANPKQMAPPNLNTGAFAPSPAQQALIAQLQARASGQVPSAAEMQQRRAFEQAGAQQMALAASARGVNPALAQRTAAYNIGGQQQALAGQAAILRAQEQAEAERLLGQLLAQQQAIGAGLPALQLQQYGIQAGQEQAAQQRQMQLFGDMLRTAGTVAGASIGGPPGAVAGSAAAGQLAPQPQEYRL